MRVRRVKCGGPAKGPRVAGGRTGARGTPYREIRPGGGEI